MRVRHTKLLSLLFSLTTILLHAGEIPTDTLLAHFYNRAANLMEEGHYDEAQRSFDSAFATRKRKALLHVSHLAERTSHTTDLCGKDRRSLCHEKKIVLPLPAADKMIWKSNISVYKRFGLLYRQHQMNDSTLYYYNKPPGQCLAIWGRKLDSPHLQQCVHPILQYQAAGRS